MTLLSKELLSEVLGSEVTEIDKVATMWDMQVLPFWVKEKNRRGQYDDRRYHIAIETIAQKCKEWALRKGYIVDERGVNVFLLTSDGIDVVWKSYGKPFCPYRVFEPCEWIMEQTKDNK